MRGIEKVLVALFIVLEALAALFLVAVSVHGPDGLPIAAGIYLVLAAPLTWWAGRWCRNAMLLTLVGVALLAVAPGLIAGMSRLEERKFKRRVTATRVANVRDEPILSSTGRPIGVRVSYDITIPETGYFYAFASVDP